MTNPNPISGARQDQGGPQLGIRGARSFKVIDLGLIDLTASAADLRLHVPNRSGRILGIYARGEIVTTDTNADGTITAEINGTAVTGGVVTIADINDGSNPYDSVAKFFQGTRVTAANQFKPGDYVDAAWATTNAFIDGFVRVLLVVEFDYGT